MNMLKLRHDTEDWREALAEDIDIAETSCGADNDVTNYDELADELCRDVLDLLDAAGIAHQRVYQQTRGAFVLVQDGSDDESHAFYVALDTAREALYPQVLALAQILLAIDAGY